MQQMTPERLNSDEVMADWPPEAREVGEAVLKVIGSNEQNVLTFIESIGDVVEGAATFVFTQMVEAEKRLGEIPDEYQYEPMGIADMAMALVWRILEDAGVEGVDEASYNAACDMVDELAHYEETGEELGEEGGEGETMAQLPPEDEMMGA